MQQLSMMTIFDCKGDLCEPMQHLLLFKIHLIAILIFLSTLLLYLFVDVSTCCVLCDYAELIIIIILTIIIASMIITSCGGESEGGCPLQ